MTDLESSNSAAAAAAEATVTAEVVAAEGSGNVPRSGRALVWGVGAAVSLALTVLHRLTIRRSLIDLQVYRKGAWGFLHRHEIYGPGLPGPRLPYTYTPFSTVVFSPLSMMPLEAAKAVHTFISVCALFATIALIIRALSGAPRLSPRLVALASLVTFLAYWSEPVRETLGFGQINLLLMALVAVDMLALGRTRWHGVLIGIAAGVKLTPVLFIAYLFVTARRRPAVVAAISFVSSIALGWVLMPNSSYTYFFHLMFEDRRIGNPRYVGNQSLNGMWFRLVNSYHASRPLWALSALAVLVVGLWTAQRMYRRFGEPRGLAVAIVTGLLVSPISWSHHWVWWILPALVIADAAWRVRSIGVGLLAVAWSVPFYVGPFWLIARRNYRKFPPVGWQRPLADSYSILALVALGVTAICMLASFEEHPDRDGMPAAEPVGRA